MIASVRVDEAATLLSALKIARLWIAILSEQLEINQTDTMVIVKGILPFAVDAEHTLMSVTAVALSGERFLKTTTLAESLREIDAAIAGAAS